MIKRILSVSALCFALGGILPAFAASERAETLRAINWVENPTNHARRGSKGELGPYQFMPNTWRLHTKKSFHLAVVRDHADEVAIRHYEWIKQGLVSAGIDPSIYNIAMAWNCGLGAVKNGRVPMVTYHYAERVQNLVEMQHSQKAALAQTVPAVKRRDQSAARTMVSFSLEPAAPRFTIATAEPLYEPTVFTDKTPVAPRLSLEKPLFALSTMAHPQFALLP